MWTTGELLNPLALCGKVEDPARREVLMRGVLGHLASDGPHLEAKADPDWEDVQVLLVPSTPPARNKAPRIRPAAKPGLWLFAADQTRI